MRIKLSLFFYWKLLEQLTRKRLFAEVENKQTKKKEKKSFLQK